MKSDAGAVRKVTKPHEAFAILLDVGVNSDEHFCEDDQTDLAASLQLLDWVLSRKIFTESTDEFSLIFFGHEATRNELIPEYSNIYIYNDEYETAKIDWLKTLEREITSNLKCSGDFASALFVGLESLKVHAESCEAKKLTSKTVTIVSNFAGVEDENALKELLTPLAAGFKALNAQLMVMGDQICFSGPDLSSEPKNTAQKFGFEFIKSLLVEQTQPRGQPFSLELGEDFSIKMQMYIKNAETSMKFLFNPVASSSNVGDVKEGAPVPLKKIRQYETAGDGEEGAHVKFADLDKISDDAFKDFSNYSLPTAKIVEKGNIIKGYRYGQSLIPFGEAEQSLLEYPKEGKQLQLLQFTKIENILPQFLLSNTRYFLPAARDEASQRSMSALVDAMLDLDVVALCRYAYNANSNPRVACLIPKISKKSNLPVLIHYTMPFNEDLRNYEFPSIEKLGSAPTEYQLDVVDEYISSMMLADLSGANERMRCRDILNPKHQHQCQLLRQKAMHPNEPFPEVQRDKLLQIVSPPRDLVDRALPILESIKDCFPLERNIYTRIAAFASKNKSLKNPVDEVLESAKIDVDIKSSDF